MDKETIEEAAVKYRDLKLPDDLYDGFIAGAKWMQDRMYSEDEVRELLLTQRGNSYVAILTKTKDSELASLAMSAPEPSGKNGWVKLIKKK